VSGKELSQMPLEELMSELGFSSIQGKRLVKHLAEAVPANFPSLLSMTSPVHTTVKVDEETEQIKATLSLPPSLSLSRALSLSLSLFSLLFSLCVCVRVLCVSVTHVLLCACLFVCVYVSTSVSALVCTSHHHRRRSARV